MEITNPRRILAVGQTGSGLLELVQGLTGSLPTINNGSLAGTTHNWVVETQYYKTTIPIWLDEMTSASSWSAEFLAPEAREVLQSLGAFIVCFKKPVKQVDFEEVKNLLKCMAQVVKQCSSLVWGGICLAVAMPQTLTPHLENNFEDWQDLCQEYGFEFIDFGMKELMGLDRMKEALQANDWESNYELTEYQSDMEELGEGDDDALSGFQVEAVQLEKEMQEMRITMRQNQASGEGEYEASSNYEEEVEKLEAIISKIQLIRGKNFRQALACHNFSQPLD
ncbi:Uncharacterized protein C19A8.11c [Erysiphe neolycopersici]|uniref:Uncharacterized protein C19A8.11c n=1 Tax=Erysiphe neolycopersici TaxID=212602 RepID=A0A420I560_9PEZI|nr:Uncharacterized protein C19A8.11c [Erysiphe neolycopersici]